MGSVNNTIDKFGRQKLSGNQRAQLLRGPPGNGFKLTKMGNFDIDRKRLCNVGEPTDRSDAVTLGYLKNDLSSCVAETQQAIREATLVSYKQLKEATGKEVNTKLDNFFQNYFKNHEKEIMTMVGRASIQAYEQMRIICEKLIESRYVEAVEEIKKFVQSENEKLRMEFKQMLAAENSQLFIGSK